MKKILAAVSMAVFGLVASAANAAINYNAIVPVSAAINPDGTFTSISVDVYNSTIACGTFVPTSNTDAQGVKHPVTSFLVGAPCPNPAASSNWTGRVYQGNALAASPQWNTPLQSFYVSAQDQISLGFDKVTLTNTNIAGGSIVLDLTILVGPMGGPRKSSQQYVPAAGETSSAVTIVPTLATPIDYLSAPGVYQGSIDLIISL